MRYSDFVKKLFVRAPKHIAAAKESQNASAILHAAVGLAGEAAEILDLAKKHFFNGHPLDREKLIKELGDLEFYRQGLLNELDLDQHEVVQQNMEKLLARYPGGEYSDAASIARTDVNPVPPINPLDGMRGASSLPQPPKDYYAEISARGEGLE